MNAGARTVNTRRETDFRLPGKNARSSAARINLLMLVNNGLTSCLTSSFYHHLFCLRNFLSSVQGRNN
jgi:hypothetical protein